MITLDDKPISLQENIVYVERLHWVDSIPTQKLFQTPITSVDPLFMVIDFSFMHNNKLYDTFVGSVIQQLYIIVYVAFINENIYLL